MRKPISFIMGIAMLASPAFGQVRPQDCRPVLPVVDKAAAAVPQDVVTEPAAPEVAAKKRFLGLPLLLPALLAAGGVAALTGGGGGGTTPSDVSPS
jgi:hypothetical protein